MRSSLYRALVTRVAPAGVHVRMDAHWPGVEFGPLPILANGVRIDLSPITVGMADFISKGDYVLVAETTTDDFIVLGVIRNGVSSTGGL
jgi:hypothetical protein